MGWLSGFDYRKSHVINAATGAGTNYPIKIRVHYSSVNTDFFLASAPVRVQSTPILSRGGAGEWDSRNIGCSRVIVINGQRRMYYYGQNFSMVGAIGYAYSTDPDEDPPVTWTKYGSNPVLQKDSGIDWENTAQGIRMGSIILIGSTYYLYYSSQPDQAAGKRGKVGIATSPDGITWTKYGGNPVLSPDLVNEFQFTSPFVVKFGSTYYMYLTVATTDSTPWIPDQFKVATSPDGITWTMVGAVLNRGTSPAWDYNVIEEKTVYPTSDGYILVYEANNTSVWRIGMASNSNPTGIFTKCSNNPIFAGSGVGGTFDQSHVATPVIYQNTNGNLYMFYQGSPDTNYWSIGLTTLTASLNVPLNSHCRTDFGDIRFTESDGVTPLNYWMESKVDGNNAVFWVNVTADLSTTAQTIYVYYGKSDATTTSNGVNTFIFFDDFDDASIDPNKWTAVSGTIVESGGYLTLSGTNSKERSKGTLPTSIKVRYRQRVSAINGWDSGLQKSDNAQYSEFIAGISYIRDYDGAYTNTPWTGPAANTFHIYEIDWIASTSSKYYMDDIFIVTHTTNIPSSVSLLVLEGGYGVNPTIDWDWAFVGKYVSPEPSHGSWGSEEDGTAPADPTNISGVCNGVTQIDLAWTDNAVQETAYYVERDDGGWHQLDGALPADTESYSDNTIACDATYKYRVRAYNNTSGLYSNYVTLGVGLRCCLNAPSGITASCTDTNQITIIWNDNSGFDTAYYVERDDGGWHEITSLPAGSTLYIDNTITCDVAYKYRVRCTDGTIYSAYDTLLVTVTCVTPPVPPTPVTPQIGGKSKQIKKGKEPYEYSYDFTHEPIEQVVASINYPFEETRKVRGKLIKKFMEAISVNSRIASGNFSETVVINAPIILEFCETIPLVGSLIKKFEETTHVGAFVSSVFLQKLEVKGKTQSWEERLLQEFEEADD